MVFKYVLFVLTCLILNENFTYGKFEVIPTSNIKVNHKYTKLGKKIRSFEEKGFVIGYLYMAYFINGRHYRNEPSKIYFIAGNNIEAIIKTETIY